MVVCHVHWICKRRKKVMEVTTRKYGYRLTRTNSCSHEQKYEVQASCLFRKNKLVSCLVSQRSMKFVSSLFGLLWGSITSGSLHRWSQLLALSWCCLPRGEKRITSLTSWTWRSWKSIPVYIPFYVVNTRTIRDAAIDLVYSTCDE